MTVQILREGVISLLMRYLVSQAVVIGQTAFGLRSAEARALLGVRI
jgi:hypothetical protein